MPEGVVHQFVPLDTPQFMRRFLDHWQPDLALLVESEIWPNLVLETAARKIPLALINGIMSPKSFRNWRRRASLSRPIFGCFHLVLVQNEQLQKRFIRLGAPKVEVVGNLKFDAPPLPVDEEKKRELVTMIADRPHFLAASTHKAEEEQIIDVHKKLARTWPDLLTIIVPRHPERGDEIAELTRERGLCCARRSKGEKPSLATDIYIADTLGELGLFFDLAKIVFLGGSLVDAGGHNPVEVVRFGAVVVTGPHWNNQADSFTALLRGEGALEVTSSSELAERIGELMKDDRRCEKIIANAERITDEMTGAMERTLAAITPLLPPGSRTFLRPVSE